MSKSDCRKGLFPVCMAKPDNETDEVDFIWAAGDSIGVAPNVGAQAYFVINEGEAGSNSATFSGGAWALKPGESSKYDYAAYYPLVGDFYLDRTKVPVDYRGQVYRPADENKKLTSLAPHDFMAAKPTQAESSSNVAFSFNHLGALVEVQFTPDMTGNITEVALSMQTADLPYRGSFDLTADKIAITYGDDDKTAMIPVTVENMSVTEGKSTSVFFMMPPVSIESQQTYLRVNYEDGSTKMYMINVDKDLQAGFWYTLTTESSSNGLVLEDNSVFAANLADAISKTGATRIKFVTSSPVTSETVLAEYETTSKAYAVQNGEWLEVHTFCPSIVAGTSASNMFMNFTTVKEIDFTGFDTSNVQSMNGMFSNCTALTSLDLSAFNTSNVTNMNSMFYECRALESITFGENFEPLVYFS